MKDCNILKSLWIIGLIAGLITTSITTAATQNTTSTTIGNAEIAKAFADSVGVKLLPEFNDILVKAKENLDNESYKDAINLFQAYFQAKNPKTGNEVFSFEEREYVFYMTMELLAINDTTLTDMIDLDISVGEFGIDGKPYFSMAYETYKSILFSIKSNENIAKMKDIIAQLDKDIEKAVQDGKEISLKKVQLLTDYYNDVNVKGDKKAKQEFAETLKKSIELYGDKIKSRECPPELINLQKKIKEAGWYNY